MNVGALIWVSLQAVIRLLIIASVGSLFSYLGKITQEAKQSFTTLSTLVFVPCLVFVNIAGGIDMKVLKESWALLLLPVLFGAIGALLGWVVCKILAIKNPLTRKVIVLVFLFGNYGTLPLGIIESVTQEVPPFNKDPRAKEVAFAKVSLFISIASVALWTLGPFYMSWGMKKKESTFITNGVEMEDVIHSDIEDDVYSNSSDEMIEIEDFETKHANPNEAEASLVELDGSDSENMEMESNDIIREKRCSLLSKTKQKLSCIKASTLKKIFSPTVIASLLALLLVLIEPVKGVIFPIGDKEPPLKFVSKTLETLADLTVPVALILLGANLFESFVSRRNNQRKEKEARDRGEIVEATDVKMKIVMIVVLIRVFILPIILFGISFLLRMVGFINGDALTGIVVFVEATSPSAINLIIVAQLDGNKEALTTLSTILLYQYLLCCIPIVICVCVSLYILL